MKRNIAEITDAIHQGVTGFQAGEALGLNPDERGRCACPIHAGHDKNMKLWKDESRFYCHVCHASGDSIALVQTVNQCTFWEAVEWLNTAFSLGLNIDKPMDEKARERAFWAKERRNLEREDREREKRIDYALYILTGKLLCDLEDDAKRYRPQKPWEGWDKRFVTALQLLPQVRALVEELSVKVIGVKHE